MAVKLTVIGEAYRGHDGDEWIEADTGETIEVSDEKAAQLAEDFPGRFEKASGRRGAGGEG